MALYRLLWANLVIGRDGRKYFDHFDCFMVPFHGVFTDKVFTDYFMALLAAVARNAVHEKSWMEPLKLQRS